jgi:hypothetical protein
MTWYIVLGIIVFILFSLLYFYNKRMRVSHLFTTMYLAWYDETGSVKTALRKGVENFTYRYPFNQLSDNDIVNIVEAFSKSENPSEALARLMQYADANNSIDVLNEYVVQMNEHIAQSKTMND